jgi:hypothetical protein
VYAVYPSEGALQVARDAVARLIENARSLAEG